MSYRTNRKTGGTFRTRDYTPSELASQTRRFHCARCEAMLGEDVSPSVAAMEAGTTGHEVAGSPITTFVSRAELNEHIRNVHGGLRRADTATRHLGRSRSTRGAVTTESDVTMPEGDHGFMEHDNESQDDIGGERNFLDNDEGVFADDRVVKKKRSRKSDTTIDDEPFSVDEEGDTILGGDESVTAEDTVKEGEFFP